MKVSTALTPQLSATLIELKRGKRTTLQLMRATGAIRVGALVHALRLIGFDIHTEIVRVPTRHKKSAHVARYTLNLRRRRRLRVA